MRAVIDALELALDDAVTPSLQGGEALCSGRHHRGSSRYLCAAAQSGSRVSGIIASYGNGPTVVRVDRASRS